MPNINILYEDEHIVAIDKPAGLAVHPDGRTNQETISDWFVQTHPQVRHVGEALGEIVRPGVVHRLDKETSGVLLLAKTQEGHAHLKKQFQEHTINKIYHAIVSGFMKSDSGKVDKPIGRSPNDFRKHLAGRGARGELREALTFYKVLKRFTDDLGNNFTYLEVRPKTGRTHQIRVHMKFLQHPLVGDELYNTNKPRPDGVGRLALHAKEIEFQNLAGEVVKVEAPLPVAFSKILC